MTFSVLALFRLSVAGPYGDLERQLGANAKPEKIARSIPNALASDDQIQDLAHSIRGGNPQERAVAWENLQDYVASMAKAENLGEDRLAHAQAVEIKRSPLYRDDHVQSANWFSRAAQNLLQLLKKWLNFKLPKSNVDAQKASGILGLWVYGIAWALLLGLALLFAYVVVRHARWKLALKRRAKAMLEEDEPERTLDEWLERADLLEREGRYREAVRCLYLACLLKFDEARIARFERSQTNWEHLHRIEASPNLPPNLNFRDSTQLFDRIWYGHMGEGRPDVERFRKQYLLIGDSFKARAA